MRYKVNLLKISLALLVAAVVSLHFLGTPSPALAMTYEECVAVNGVGECNAIFHPEDLPTVPVPTFDPLAGPTAETFNLLNPFILSGSAQSQQLSTPGGIISRILQFSFPLAGLILFVMLVWGGAEVTMGSLNKKSVDAGKQRITAAVIGFILLFSSYWIAQILELIFGIVILG